MANFSRRSLARYAVEQLVAKQPIAKLSAHLAAALIDNKMIHQTDLLVDDINEQLESRGLAAKAIVTSAGRLSASLKSQLAKQVQKAAKVDSVSIIENLDPAVIGGVRIETARHTWDQTIARRLSDIKGGI